MIKKSVVLILAVSAVFSLGTLAHIVFSKNPVVIGSEKTVLKTERPQSLIGSENIVVSVFPKPKEVTPAFLPVKSDLGASLGQEANSFLSGSVFTQEEIRLIIERFGKPTKEAFRWITKDARHTELLADLDAKFGESLSKEAREVILESARLLWFQQDMLDQMYESNFSMSMDSYELGLREIVRMYQDSLAQVLDDEQYLAMNDESKTDRFLGREVQSAHSENYSEMTSLFPALRNGDRSEVSSSADVYKVVPLESVDMVRRISRERSRLQRENHHLFLAGDIPEEEFESRNTRIRQEANDKIDAILSPEQERFLYGSSRRWDAMMPEERKRIEDES